MCITVRTVTVSCRRADMAGVFQHGQEGGRRRPESTQGNVKPSRGELSREESQEILALRKNERVDSQRHNRKGDEHD